MVSKEAFIAAHEELIAEYLDEHPEASDSEAYDATADLAYDRMVDQMADRGDQLNQMRKEGLI